MQTNKKIDESVERLNQFKKNLNESAENTEDVKNGEATPDEERAEPTYVLYNQIADTTVKIMKLPSTSKLFTDIANKLDEDTAQKLMELMAICMTHSAYHAVAWYDQLLKEELDKQFNNVGAVIDNIRGDVMGQHGALEVFKEKLGKIENQLKMEKMQ